MPDVPVWMTTPLKIMAAVGVFFAFHFALYALPRMGRGDRHGMRRVLSCFFSRLIPGRNRRKAIDAMQEARRQRGMPPLENPFL